MQQVQTYTAKERNMFLTGMFGQNMIYNIIATGLYYYFQNVICLPAIALGWIFAIARIWDAINDPMMGSIVDKTKSKWGKCKPYLMFAPPVICVITIATFLNGNYAQAKLNGNSVGMVLIVAWAALSYILWGMSYTAGDVPLWGIISRMSEVEKDRSTLIALSRIIASIGAAAVVVSILPISQAVNDKLGLDIANQKGYIITAIIITGVATVLFELAGLGVVERVPESSQSKSMKESFALMWNCVPFRRILISGLLRSPLQLLMTVVITLFSYYYCQGNLMSAFSTPRKFLCILVIGGGLFSGQFIAMAICPKLIEKFDVKKVYNLASLSAITSAMIFVIYLIAPTELEKIGWLLLVGLCLLGTGAGFGVVNVCQSVMIADCIDYEEYRNGYRPDGVFFSGQSFIVKFSAGMASIISAYVYAAVGYTDVNIDKVNKALAEGANFAVQFPQYSKAMWFLISIPPAIGVALAVLPTLKYEIDKKTHEKMLAELVERHKEQ